MISLGGGEVGEDRAREQAGVAQAVREIQGVPFLMIYRF